MKIIPSQTQRILSLGLFCGGAVATILGMALMVKSPKALDRETLGQIYASGVDNNGAIINAHSKAAHATGLIISLLGCFSLAGGMVLAERHPTSLAPASIPPNTSLLKGNSTATPIALDDLSENTLNELADNVAQLLAAAPWLRKLMGAFVVLVIGPSGSGKSTIAMAIALLRAIYKRQEAPLIIDPDTDANLLQGTWLFGDLYGSSSDGEGLSLIRKQLLTVMGSLYEPFRHGGSKKRRTVIIDEVGKWETANYPELNGLSSGLIGWANQTARKQGWAPVLILHGESAGNAGGKALETGVFQALKTTAAVVRLEGSIDDEGELTWGKKATFKPAGTEYSASNFEPIVLPDTLRPGALREQLQELMLALGYSLNTDHSVRLDQGEFIDQLRNEIQKNLNIEEEIEKLNRAWITPVEDSIPTDETYNLIPDFTVFQQHPVTKELFTYCFKKYALNAPIEIRKVQQNWGKDYDNLTSDEIRSLVNHLVQHHIALWLEMGKRFCLRAAPPVG